MATATNVSVKNFFFTALCLFVSTAACLAQQPAHVYGFRIAKYKGDKTAAISYTFDDGLKEHYTLVAPRFKDLGFRATFWINGSKINESESTITDTSRMTWAQLKEMSQQGHEISNHGWAHKNFGRFTLEEIKEDITKNDSIIVANIGIMPRTFCYPNNNKSNRQAVVFVNQNRVGTRTEQFSIGGKSTHENLEKRVTDLLANHDWGVGMTHGITYGYDRFGSAEIFWEHLKKVKAQEDKIWVATFRQVAAYLKEQKNVSYTITETKSGFSVTPELLLDKTIFTEPLTAVIEQSGIKKITVRQGKKELKVQVARDKAVFDFDPFGGAVDVVIQK